MRRREFITLLGGATAAWPVEARAQSERVRRVGVLMSGATDDADSKARVGGLLQGLQDLGWTERRNIRIDIRWAAGNAESRRQQAAEVASLAPDVIVATGSPSVVALQQVTRAIPIVFVNVADPVGAGFVESLARPGGNTTGFTPYEFGIGAKWLELLKEIAPTVTRAAIIRDPANPAALGQFGAMQSVAPSFRIELSLVNMRDATDIANAVAAFARLPNGGLILIGSALALVHRDLIVMLAARHRLPTIYWNRAPVVGGGLVSYGPDLHDEYKRAAGYVDRILKGEKPTDLPVQAPTKYQLAINLRTAKALGLTVPQSMLARADEVIE